MTVAEAVAFIRPAVEPAGGTWTDLGAGSGTFTEALSWILGDGGRVLAVDRDPVALATLTRLATHGEAGARVDAVAGDLEDLDGVPELRRVALDGALFANSLHYLATPEPTLARVGRLLRPGGRIVVIEYERTTSNPWVPYPLPLARLESLAAGAGLDPPVVVGRRPSWYQGEMYCAVTAAQPTGGPGPGRLSDNLPGNEGGDRSTSRLRPAALSRS